jgi:hypothetical protein
MNTIDGAAAVLAHEAATQEPEGSVGAAPQAARTRPIPQASPHRGGKRRGSTGATATPAEAAVIHRVEQVAHQAGSVPWPGAVGAKTTAMMRKRSKKKTAAKKKAAAKKGGKSPTSKASRRKVKRGKMGA